MYKKMFWLLIVGFGLCLCSCEPDGGLADCGMARASAGGFVRNFAPEGASLVISVWSVADSDMMLRVCGMNLEPDGSSEAIIENGDEAAPFAFTEYDVWEEAEVRIRLHSGYNQLKLSKKPGSSGAFRIDYVELRQSVP